MIKKLLFFLTPFYLCFASEIVVPANQFFIDKDKALIVSNLNVSLINLTWADQKTSILLDVNYNFEVAYQTIEVGIPYKIINTSDNKVYQLYFTELPLINITTNGIIVDEPDVSGKFKLVDTDNNVLISNIGIQYRGGFSQSLPKKSLEVNFWTDETGNEKHDVSLLGLHSDDGFNLQAMYNEALRFHSKTNNDLWKLIHKPYYINKESEAVSGIEMKYAELFLNGQYRGIYCVGEKVNRKLLKLKKYNQGIKGELYKGDDWGESVLFNSLLPYNNSSLRWGGFEYKHPKDLTDWTNLANLVDFVVNETDSNFFNEYKSKFNIDNAVDYFIFLNLIRATDNKGKNLYVAKYNTNEPYFYVPWDLDGTFGTIWNGQHQNITNDLQKNGFYNRLLQDCSTDGFREKLELRWTELRGTLLQHSNLMNMLVGNYNTLNRNGVYERESIAWPDFSPDAGEIDYISDWLTNRLSYLDSEFSKDCINLDTETFNKLSQTILYPNPTSDIINISFVESDDYQVYVYDNSGKLLLKSNSKDIQDKISLKHLSNGVYYIKIVDSQNKIIIKRILKES